MSATIIDPRKLSKDYPVLHDVPWVTNRDQGRALYFCSRNWLDDDTAYAHQRSIRQSPRNLNYGGVFFQEFMKNLPKTARKL